MTKMKTKTLFYMALTAMMMTLAACSQDDELMDAAPEATPIEFEITDGGFADVQTRAVEDGYKKKFTNGDACGLYIMNGSTLKATNVKLTASDENSENGELTWKTENGTEINAADGDKYFLYYPYKSTTDMDGKVTTSAADSDEDFFDPLIKGWVVAQNQNNYDYVYTMHDLMTAKGTVTDDGGTLRLSFKLGHRMALAEIVAPVEVEFTNSSGYCTPYKTEDWKYRLIVNPTTAENDGGIQIQGKIGSKTFTISSAKLGELKRGQYKTFKVGSSYYVDNDGVYHVYDDNGLRAWAAAVKNKGTISCTLEADITMPAPTETDGSNWEPAGNSNSSIFAGTFDGNGHTISGLVINKPKYTNIGFIKELRGTVKNLTLNDARITGASSIGTVAGTVKGSGTIENCHVTGTSTITGNDTGYGSSYVGGITSYMVEYNGNIPTITACHVSDGCTVTGTQGVGGIVGISFQGAVKACYALCSLNGSSNLGGICGEVTGNGMSFTACYSKCKFTDNAATSAGGILGGSANQSDSPNFSACFWNGTNVSKGVGYADSDPTGITQGMEWELAAAELAATTMNAVLGSNFGYQYEVNGDSQTEPLILVKKTVKTTHE